MSFSRKTRMTGLRSFASHQSHTVTRGGKTHSWTDVNPVALLATYAAVLSAKACSAAFYLFNASSIASLAFLMFGFL